MKIIKVILIIENVLKLEEMLFGTEGHLVTPAYLRQLCGYSAAQNKRHCFCFERS